MPPLKKAIDSRQLNPMLLFRCMTACSAARKEAAKKIQTGVLADMKVSL
jgi:hypothetical protein